MNHNTLQQLLFHRVAPQRAPGRDKSQLLLYTFLLYQAIQQNGLLQRFNSDIQQLPRSTVLMAVSTFIIHYFGNEIYNIIPLLPLSTNHILQYAIHPLSILYNQQWYRIYTGIWYHLSDNHMYLNLVSLLYKGTQLEDQFGTRPFLTMTAVLITLTGTTHTTLAYLASKLLHMNGPLNVYSAGLSGLLFSYSVLLHYYSPALQYTRLGITVPNKYAAILELAVTYLMAPEASFIGHLSGILAGSMYVHIIQYMNSPHITRGSIRRGFHLDDNTLSGYTRQLQRKMTIFYTKLYNTIFTQNTTRQQQTRRGTPPTSVATTPLTSAMAALREAGFRDLRANAAALRQTNNDVNAAVDILLRNQ